MLILLPPSEGKKTPVRGLRLDLDRLSSPELTEPRSHVLSALVAVCVGPIQTARKILDLTLSMDPMIEANARLASARTAPASSIYTGVLFSALDLASLTGSAKRRANARLAVCSALFGLLRPSDPIPAYRLSGAVTLPGLGTLSSFWRGPLDPVITAAAGVGMLIDLRSSTYISLWPISRHLQAKSLTVKIWQRSASGAVTAISHSNKHCKGEIARLLATCDDVKKPTEAVDLLNDFQWDCSIAPESPHRLDVTIGESA